MGLTGTPEKPGKDTSLSILKARIALLATAIGGPDYTSQLDPPPYKLGDDCLACLRDLKRWFKLVDDQQNRWDVALACADFCILIDDLLPILIDWENKCALAVKLSKRNSLDATNETAFRNKEYHDSIALNCLQLMVLMTWPLILTDQTPSHQVALYSDLKKHQISYKKHILLMENGKALKAANRLALKVLQMDKLDRTPRDNMILRLVLNFFRNLLAIEPGELNISTKQLNSTRSINTTDMLPPNVSMNDINLNAAISAFHHNKVLGLLLTLSSSSGDDFDQEFINIPLMEVFFYMTKDVNPRSLFVSDLQRGQKSKYSNGDNYTPAGFELTQLLEKERKLKKIVIQNTSTRHSRFGALLSIQTADNVRLTVSGGQNLLDDGSALKKLDSRKKWNKRIVQKQDEVLTKGLPNSLLNSQLKSVHFQKTTKRHFTKFMENFINSGFNPLLHRITNHFTTEQDQMLVLEQIQYLLFYSWFLNYNRERCRDNDSADTFCVSSALRETTFILVSSLLRKGYEDKNHIVVHAGMIAFNELLLLLGDANLELKEDADFILSRLLSDERIQLLSNLPKSAFKHSLPYIRSCVQLTHTALKTFEAYDDGLVVTNKSKPKNNDKGVSEDLIQELMRSENIDRDEAIEVLTVPSQQHTINYQKVQRYYMNESTIDTFLDFLRRFKELEDEDIKQGISFLHRVLIQATEQSLLFRIDFIVLLRDMLSPQGISRSSNIRKHVEKLSNYLLYKLKKKLKTSPAWFVGLLFPLLHDSEVGFYQKYGEMKAIKKSAFYAVPPSRFKPIEDEEQLPASHLLDIKYGIVISTLLDDGKHELLNQLEKHMETMIDGSHPSGDPSTGTEEIRQGVRILKLQDAVSFNPVCFDKDFRTLLKLAGYYLPTTVREHCYYPEDHDITMLKESLYLVRKYLATPFETPNGLPSSSYLIRPRVNRTTGLEEDDGWVSNENYDFNDPGIVNDDDDELTHNDDSYFDELQRGMEHKLQGRDITKGLATSKKMKKKGKPSKRRSRSTLPEFETEDTVEHLKKDRVKVSSKEIISDSEDEETVSPIFFENEMYLRFLLDKYNGQLPDDKYTEFGKFATERMTHNGKTTSDFFDLFGGPIPPVTDLHQVDTRNTAPDRTLFSLSERIAAEIQATANLEVPDDAVKATHLFDHSAAETSNGLPLHDASSTDGFVSNKRLAAQYSAEPDDELEPPVIKKRQRVFIEDDEE